MSVSCKEFAKNNTSYIYDLYLTEKLAKHLMVGGKSYKVQKYIFRAFKNLKLMVRIHPLILYYYIIFFFLISIEFQKVRKAGQVYKVPQSIMEEDIFLLRTVKLFSNVLKAK
jgi:ribosomal protein S7